MKCKLNEKGQCPICKIKSLTYKRKGEYFCHRCDRAYRIDTKEQIENWAYKNDGERKC